LKNWEFEHKIDSGHELHQAADGVDQSADDVKHMTHASAATKFEACKKTKIFDSIKMNRYFSLMFSLLSVFLVSTDDFILRSFFWMTGYRTLALLLYTPRGFDSMLGSNLFNNISDDVLY
jgi:hypothetical protein